MTVADTIVTKSKGIPGISRILSVAIVAGSLAAFAWVASGAVQGATTLSDVRWSPFVGAVALQFVMLFVLMFIWERLLGRLMPDLYSRRPAPTRAGLFTAYSRSWLARYIPGRVWAVGGRALLAHKQGVPPENVARSMVLEVIFTYGLVTVIGGALLASAYLHILAGWPVLILGLLAFVFGVPWAQSILSAGLRGESKASLLGQIRTKAHRLVVGEHPLTLSTGLWGVLAYSVYSLMQLAFIILVASSFTDLDVQTAAIVAGVWGVSITLGWVSFLAPVGLGVRDGLAFVLFSQIMDPASASLVVASSRIVSVAADIVFVGAVELLALGMGVRRTQQQTAS